MKNRQPVTASQTPSYLIFTLTVILLMIAIPQADASTTALKAIDGENQFFRATFRDLEDNDTQRPNNLAKVYLERGHSYEVRIIFDLPDSIDLTANRLSILIPTKKTGGILYEEPMYTIVESLNGEELIRSRKHLCSIQWFPYKVNVTSQPIFYNEAYPDGTHIDEKLFSDGVILNDIEGAQKGYISFYVELVSGSVFTAWFSNPIGIVIAIGGAAAGIYYVGVKERRKKNSGTNPDV